MMKNYFICVLFVLIVAGQLSSVLVLIYLCYNHLSYALLINENQDTFIKFGILCYLFSYTENDKSNLDS